MGLETDVTVEGVDDRYEAWFAEMAESADEKQTDLAFKEPELFSARDLVKNTRTDEIFLVQSMDPCQVQRGIADSAAPMEQGDELCILGKVRFAEKSEAA